MAHFARIDENNLVIHVSVVDNNNILDENGNESEEVGITYLKNIHGGNSKWKQTSYNSSFRKMYAGMGYSYNEQYDIFLPPKPFNSWNLNTETLNWEAPIPSPNLENKIYFWDEENQNWIENDYQPLIDE
jgi:hypothetical protein